MRSHIFPNGFDDFSISLLIGLDRTTGGKKKKKSYSEKVKHIVLWRDGEMLFALGVPDIDTDKASHIVQIILVPNMKNVYIRTIRNNNY